MGSNKKTNDTAMRRKGERTRDWQARPNAHAWRGMRTVDDTRDGVWEVWVGATRAAKTNQRTTSPSTPEVTLGPARGANASRLRAWHDRSPSQKYLERLAACLNQVDLQWEERGEMKESSMATARMRRGGVALEAR